MFLDFKNHETNGADACSRNTYTSSTHTHSHTHTCTHLHTHIHTHTHTHMHTHASAQTHMQIHIRIHTHKHTVIIHKQLLKTIIKLINYFSWPAILPLVVCSVTFYLET